MSLFKRSSVINQLSAPVKGDSVNVETIFDGMSIPGQLKFAIRPSNDAIFAPLNGEVTDLTSHHIAMTAISGDCYWLTLQRPANETAGTFEWQVRIGDSISPLTLLGTLTATDSKSLIICSRIGLSSTTETQKQRRFSAIFG